MRTFVTVAEEGSVSKASLCLHISQPGLSRQIQELEQELGLQLFDRVGRRLALTSEGEELLGSCRSLLRDVGSLSEQAQLLSRGDSGTLRLAASPVLFETVLSTFLPQYAERYPGVRVKLIEAAASETLALLERGQIQLGIAMIEAGAARDRHLGIHPMPPLEILAACPPSFRLERGSMIDISRIAAHPLLLPDSGLVRRKRFDAICDLAGIKPIIQIESRAPHTLLAFAEAGLGVAIISSAVRTHHYALRVVRVSFKRKPIQYPLAVVWNNRRALPRYAKEFCDSLAIHMRKLFRVAHSAVEVGAPKRQSSPRAARARRRQAPRPSLISS